MDFKKRKYETARIRFTSKCSNTALLAESESALQDIVDVVRQNSEEKGLSMNVKKTKTMVVCRDETPNVRIVINGQVQEQVK